MDIRLVGIPLAFLMMAGVLCWCLAVMRYEWKIRLALVVVIPLGSILVLESLPSYMGWPTKDIASTKVALLWVEIREPNRATNDPGALYLWVSDYEERNADVRFLVYPSLRGEPRAYQFSYDRRSHEMLVRAKEKILSGSPVIIEMLPKHSKKQSDINPRRSSGSGENGEWTRNRENGVDDDMFRMYELPNGSFPEKRR